MVIEVNNIHEMFQRLQTERLDNTIFMLRRARLEHNYLDYKTIFLDPILDNMLAHYSYKPFHFLEDIVIGRYKKARNPMETWI